MLFGNTSFSHEVEHFVGIHSLDSATGVTDDHDLFHSQLIDGYKDAAHRRVERIGDDSAGVFDNLDVAIFISESRREQFDQAGVHAGNDGYFLVRVFACDEAFVTFAFNKLLVVL